MNTRFKTNVLAAGIAAAFSSASALAMGPAPSAALTRGVTAPETGVVVGADRYRADGTAITLGRPAYQARIADPESMAREFIVARQRLLGLGVQPGTLVRTGLREGRQFSVVRFSQTSGGLPVYGSDIAVSVTSNGRIIHVANSAVRGVVELAGPATKKVATASARSAADAVAIARQYLGLGELRLEKTRQMVFVDADGSNRVVWCVNAIGKAKFTGDWELVIDANSGEVLRARDVAAYADGTATVHTPDPLSYAHAAYGNTGFTDNNNADSPQQTAALVNVTLPGITQSGSNWQLSGPYMVCADIEAPNDAACPSQSGTDFSVTRSAMTFDATMTYYHISAYLKYVNETLGVTAMPLNHAGGIHVDPHGFNGDDNSRYSSSGEDLSFGQGGVDDAEDADVIIHELGHGIHDWITGGNLSQTQGLSEGFGDYTAGSYSRDFPNQWLSSDTAYNWVFSWDGHNEWWSGRVLNWQLTHTYPGNLGTPAPHTPGQYWASCNLEARKNVQLLDAVNGGRIFDKAYFEGLSMTGASTNQKDAAQAVIDAAAALGYTQQQINAIGTAFNSGNTGGNTGCTYAVTVPTVTADPVAQVSPGSLNESVETGFTTSTSFAIGNPGGADLNWTLDTSDSPACATPSTVAWLTLAPTSGTVVALGTATDVDVGIDAATLAPGSYSTNLCVHSNDPATPVVAVPLSLTVDPHADLIFKNGFDSAVDPNVVDSGQLDLSVPSTFDGMYINWMTFATCTTGCTGANFDFNPYNSGTALSMFWPRTSGPEGGVGDGTTYSVLASGATIDASSTFMVLTSAASAANFAAGVGHGYLGFQMACPAGTCYGYADISTTAPNGFPMTVHRWWYNSAGAAITIP